MRVCECGRKEYVFWVNDDGKYRCFYCTFKTTEVIEEEEELKKTDEEIEREENENK